jgi:PAS domain S-box-containing protein
MSNGDDTTDVGGSSVARAGLPAVRRSIAETRAALADAVRLAALRATDLQSAMRVEALRPIVRLAARALRVPVAQINVLTADAQVPVVACAPAVLGDAYDKPVGLESSYCQHVVASGQPLIVSDARIHPLVFDSLGTTQSGIIAYAGVPLRAPAALGPEMGGRVLGTICVVDFAPREWSDDEVNLLTDLATAVTAELEIRAAAANIAARDVAAAAASALQTVDNALAESEARFQTIADSIPQLAWMADDAGKIYWFNQRWYDFTGTTFEDMRGFGWQSVHHPDDVSRVSEKFRQAIADGAPWEDTFPLRASDGSWRWFLSRALPVRDPATNALSWFGTNTDITERIAHESERERLLESERAARLSAEQAGLARTRFLATMSHELRTPLNAIGGYAELLSLGLRGPVTEAQQTDFQRIRRAQKHLLGVINDILSFAKLESGSVLFHMEAVPLSVTFLEVAVMIATQAASKGLALEVEACAPEVMVLADHERLKQVLMNLLSNAVKFTSPPGTVRMKCAVDHERVRIYVSDSGIGISADKLEAVFQPFMQVDADFNRSAQGTGLGLAISRDLARGMNAELTVQSEYGAGSTFELSIPRAGIPAPRATVDGTPRERAMVIAPVGDDPPYRATFEAVRDPVQEELLNRLRSGGVGDVLEYLNSHTQHRFTGLYRFDGSVLRNVALFDREQGQSQRGADSPLCDTYCAIVGETQSSVVITDATIDPRTANSVERKSVLSYCGALVRAVDGAPIGTLCSFDPAPQPVMDDEIALLEVTARLLGNVVAQDALVALPEIRPSSERSSA